MSIVARGRSARLVALVLATVWGAGLTFAAAGETADAERQSAMFKRIFSYDKDLRGAEKIVVLIVAESKNAPDATEVASVFREKGFYPAIVGIGDLTDDLTATLSPKDTVMYVMPGVPYGEAKRFASEKGFLSISGLTSLAEAGHVSVSVEVLGDRPEIVVNMGCLQGERHELSSELLNLARVIR